jgi:Fe-S-cluster containining protein
MVPTHPGSVLGRGHLPYYRLAVNSVGIGCAYRFTIGCVTTVANIVSTNQHMTDCSRCGDCCDVIPLQFTKKDVAAGKSQSREFIIKHWHRISREEAAKRIPTMGYKGTRFYRCDKWDSATRLCTVQDEKPPVCRDFPWYGDTPEPDRLRHFPRCSFWADVPDSIHVADPTP